MTLPRLPNFLHTRPILFPLVSLALIVSLAACVKRARNHTLTIQTKANEQQSAASPQTDFGAFNKPQPHRININTASAKELEALPGIGKGLAERIIAHREKFGPFRRVEHLIVVRGISDRRYRVLRDLIAVE